MVLVRCLPVRRLQTSPHRCSWSTIQALSNQHKFHHPNRYEQPFMYHVCCFSSKTGTTCSTGTSSTSNDTNTSYHYCTTTSTSTTKNARKTIHRPTRTTNMKQNEIRNQPQQTLKYDNRKVCNQFRRPVVHVTAENNNEIHYRTRNSSSSSNSNNNNNNSDSTSWEQVNRNCHRFMQQLQKHKRNNTHTNNTIALNLIQSKIPDLLLQCIQYPHPSGDSGPMANQLLNFVVDIAASTTGPRKNILILPNNQAPTKTQHTNHPHLHVTAEMYSLAIEAWLKSNHTRALDEAETLLWELLSDNDDDDDGTKISSLLSCPEQEQAHDRINSAFALVVHGFLAHIATSSSLDPANARTNHPCSNASTKMDRMERLVDRMKGLYNVKNDIGKNNNKIKKNPTLRPNTTAFNAMLRVLAKKEGPEAALQLLLQMMDDDPNRNNNNNTKSIVVEPPPPPNLISFSTVMDAFAKCGDAMGAQHVLDLMKQRAAAQHVDHGNANVVQPNTVCFNILLDAWTKSGHPNAGEKAEQVLHWMLESSSADNSNGNGNSTTVKPDSWSYTAVIDAWSKSRPTKDSAMRAEGILRQMLHLQQNGHDIHPNHVSFTAVVDAWSKVNDPNRAEAIVALMEELQKAGDPYVKPTTTTYNSLIHAWTKSSSRGGDPHMAGKKALEVLERMEQRHEAPNTRTYNSVMAALQKSGSDGIQQALELLERLEASHNRSRQENEPIINDDSNRSAMDNVVGPDTVTFNTALGALAKSPNKGRIAAEKAKNLLDRMLKYEAQGDSDIAPNTITYNTVMNIIGKSSVPNAAIRAEVLLEHMEDSYQSGQGNTLVAPSEISYSTCITAWAKCRDRPEKVARAQSILVRMKEAHGSGNASARPTLIPYNGVLNACCFSVGNQQNKVEAARVALETIQELRQSDYGEPNALTYATVLKALGRNLLRGEELNQAVEREFLYCAKGGHVSKKVVAELRNASNSVFRKYFEGKSENRSVPHEWRRNVSEFQ